MNMQKTENDVNSGVEALTGFAFQRNCSIYLVLENPELLNSNFFICIEHHDDVIFGHLNESNILHKVGAYQAKKSTGSWGVNAKTGEILAKMTAVGSDLRSDDYIKTDDYSHELTFLTNKSIKLNCGKRKGSKHVEIVREKNVLVKFQNLHAEIKENIIKKISASSYHKEELDNLVFAYVDMGNTDKSQQDQLRGMLASTYKEKIPDTSAALDLILKLFREVETVFNQGDESKFLDKKKKVYGGEIKKALDIICTKAKAYQLWRENAKELSGVFKIPISKSSKYQEYINNSFDYFKDLKQVEFRKILRFVDGERDVDDIYVEYSDCLFELRKRYFDKFQTQLDNDTVSFAIIAAFVQTRDGSE